MTNFYKKIKLLYIPFLLTAIDMCGLYTFLNWLLIMHLEVVSVKDSIVNFGIPLVLPAILVLIYLRPKFKLLNLRTKSGGSWADFYMFILWGMLAIPTIIAQHYVEKAAGTLTELQHISQLDSLPKTKYYTIKDLYLDKGNIGASVSFEVSGKHNEDFDMYIYVVMPMYNSYADTTRVVSWLGLTYSKNISNNLDEKEKEAAYLVFENESNEKMGEVDMNQFAYLTRVPYSDKSVGLHDALMQHVKHTSTNETQLFLGVSEPFADRTGNSLMWIFISFGIGCILWLVMILIPSFDTEVLTAHEAGILDANEDMKEFIDYFKPKQGFFITPVIMYLNVGIFLAMFFSGLGFMSFDGRDLIVWGANYGPLTENGEWWRLLSSTFLHGGFMHVFANMYGLLFVGIFLEPLLGKLKYAGVYLITGIIASGASLWWNDATVSIGASGAIFGLYGVFLALLVTRVFPKELGAAFLMSTLFFVGFNLLMGLIGSGIDNAAHIGGLVSGFLIGLALYPSLKDAFVSDPDLNGDEENTIDITENNQ